MARSEGFISAPKNRRHHRRFHRSPFSGKRAFQRVTSAILPIVNPIEALVQSDRRIRDGEIGPVFLEKLLLTIGEIESENVINAFVTVSYTHLTLPTTSTV